MISRAQQTGLVVVITALAAVAFGDPARSLAKVANGTALRCTGFLARRYRTGITIALHVNEFELLQPN